MQELADAPDLAEPGAPGRTPAGRRRTRWPIVIGVISLVVCVPLVAIERVLIGDEYLLTIKFLRDSTAWPEEVLPAVQIVLGVLMGGMPWFLVDGGVSTLRRRRRARGSHLAYAWITLAFVAAFSLVMVSAILFVAPEYVEHEPGLIRKIALGMIQVDTMLLAYPVFIILWFRRPRVRQEIREWK